MNKREINKFSKITNNSEKPIYSPIESYNL